MNPRRSPWQRILNVVLSCLCSTSLVLALLPCSTANAVEQAQWSSTIDEMLASGEYVEGEAIVALKGNEEGALTAQSSLPVDDLEPLMEVGALAVGSAIEAEGLTAQASEDVTITLVKSNTLSTEEILRSLANDPRVVFAEPNYYADFLDDEQVDAVQVVAAELAAGEESAMADDTTVDDGLATENADATADQQEELDAVIGEDVSAPAEELAPLDEAKVVEDTEAVVTAEEPTTQEAESEDVAMAEEEELQAAGSAEPLADITPIDDSTLALVSLASGVTGDLTTLQWGNWDTSMGGVKPLETDGNHSINVPNFGTAQVGANMDNEVIVAVLDGAIDFSNPDLADRAYTFSPALREQLGCDEHGFNASAESLDGKIVHYLGFHGDSHGTHCAGIIGATWDGQGVSGVASNVKIVSIQMMGTQDGAENGKTSLANGLRGFAFVKRANEAGVGIKVTSNSWGMYQVSKALDAALRDLGETQGVVSVFAAFNDTKDNDVYPADPSVHVDNPYTIIVAATDQFGALASFSNFGQNTVNLGAPGCVILSTDTTAQGMYLPAATPDSNIVFEDFESDAPIVSIQQIDTAGNLVMEPGTICTETHLMGEQSIKVPIDTSITIEAEDGGWSFVDTQAIRIDVDLAAAQKQSGIDIVESLRQAQELYLGFGLTTSSACDTTQISSTKTNVTGDGEVTSSYPSTAKGEVLSVYTPLIDENTVLDVDNLDGHLIVDLYINAADDCTELYLDELGIGIEKVPYVYKSGTSMACPCISGATAVLASQTGLEGAQLASLVRSKVRIPESGPLAVRTGGMFDFTVEGSPDVDEAEEPALALAPAIVSLDVEGTTVTITGSNFGSSPGTVAISRYIVGQEPDEESLVAMGSTSATVTSWADDQVVLALDEPFVGIMQVVLTNAAGKFDTAATFVSKGENVYEQDLPFPSGTGDPYEFGDQGGAEPNFGDFETKGPLVGLGCKLYYLPADQSIEQSPIHQRAFCFDLKTETWSELPPLPEPLYGVSAVMHDGAIVVEGATPELLPSGEYDVVPARPDAAGGENTEERVYVYDPGVGAWSEACSDNMLVGQTIINDDGQLKLVGGYVDVEGYASAAPCYYYDRATGLGEEICECKGFTVNPQAVAKDGVIYIYIPSYYGLVIVKDGESNVYYDALPELVQVDKDAFPQIPSNTREDPFIGWGVLAVASEGVIFVGPPAADGSSDTYILREGSTKFEPYEKRASEARVQSVAACTYRGRLFAIGSSWAEPNQRLFRATKMSVPEYPGDILCEESVTPTPAPAPAPAPERAAKLPKTGDGTPRAAIAVVGAVGVLLLSAGVYLHRRRSA